MAIVANADTGSRAAGRATILQLRAPGSTAAVVEREAARLVPVSPVPVVISSRLDVVLASDAAGVHLPERDVTTADARKLVGERIVGRSVHSVEAAREAEREGADYVIYGPVWASASHPGVAPVGVEALAEVAGSVRIPVLAIGGVNEDRVAEVHRAGAAGFAAIGMFA